MVSARVRDLALVALAAAGVSAAVPPPDADGKYTLTTGTIRAKFIPYGATLTELYFKDRNGTERDIVLGYDNASYYPVDPGHPVYNAVPGRYANRIGNGMYKISNSTFHTEKNDGPNTLHSGTNNWSFRTWNVTSLTNQSITFSIYDPSNSSLGMMGHVEANVTYSLDGNRWNIKMEAISPDVKTPIMLTQHTYFNLDAFANPSTQKIWNHTLYMPHASRNLAADKNALPTGQIINITKGDMDDFYSQPRQIGFMSDAPTFKDHCGGGCNGYNGQWLEDPQTPMDAVVARLSSEWSGISAELRTDQSGLVIYSCNWMDGSAQMKKSQGVAGGPRNVTSSSCVAIEAHDWVDGINHPEWGRLDKQEFGPGQKYSWSSSWTFSAK